MGEPQAEKEFDGLFRDSKRFEEIPRDSKRFQDGLLRRQPNEKSVGASGPPRRSHVRPKVEESVGFEQACQWAVRRSCGHLNMIPL